jgi:hypothetical protein
MIRSGIDAMYQVKETGDKITVTTGRGVFGANRSELAGNGWARSDD